MLLEISGPRGVQLDVFRSLKGGPVEFFGASRGAVGSIEVLEKTYAPQIKHSTGRIVCVSCKYVGLWY